MSGEQLDRKFMAAVDRLGRALRVARQATATELGVSVLQLAVLEHLADGGARRVGSLANELDITAPTVSDAVAALEKKALVVRSPDPDDRRAIVVALTDAGRQSAATATASLGALLPAHSSASREERGIALAVLLGEIRRLQRAGVITINRSCLSCEHYRAPTSSKTARCAFLRMDLAPHDLQVDCVDHQERYREQD